MTTLTLKEVAIQQGGTTVIEHLNMSLPSGAIGCLLGHSGAGKSSLLRAIAGLLPVSAGTLYCDDELLCDPDHLVPPEQRNIGMVFQHGALFPHLRVAQNIGFGLAHRPAAEREGRIAELLSLLNIAPLAQRLPSELSGGEYQRVALAQALAVRPRLLLLDEPFSQIDGLLRRTLADELMVLLRELGTTVLMVTHDLREALAYGDLTGVLHRGELLQWSSPDTLFRQPLNPLVANISGEGSFIAGEIVDTDRVRTELGLFVCPTGHIHSTTVRVLVRAHQLEVTTAGSPARVLRQWYRGQYYECLLKLPNGDSVWAHSPSPLQAGNNIHIALIPPDAASEHPQSVCFEH